MAGAGEDRGPVRLRTARMEAFSDGVFAIAITLLVLDLAVPAVTKHDVVGDLLEQWPEYLAYLVSFASIGGAWVAHSTITDYLDRADSVLLRLNLLLLFFISVLPFPTHMIGAYLHSPNAERVAVTVYGVNLFAIAAMTSIVWRYSVAEHLTRTDVDDTDLRVITEKLAPSLAFYLGAIAVGIFVPSVAVALYLVIALYLLVPFRTLVLHLRR